MPFQTVTYRIEEPMPAFLFVMRTFRLSMADAQRVVGKGRLRCDGTTVTSPGTLVCGDIEVTRFIPAPRDIPPLLATKHLAVYDKPSNVLVHPNKTQTPYSMLDEIRAHFGDEANAVHRIDKETSGLLLASRDKRSETMLKQAFEHKTVRKSYLAWVHGAIDRPFEVDAPIAKNDLFSHTKHKVFIDEAKGKPALTRFVPLTYDGEHHATLVKCFPVTGRTHQIRIHLFHVKHPILGDPIYGCDFETSNRYLDGILSEEERLMRTGAKRLMLHAQSLAFTFEGVRFLIESRYPFLEEKAMIATPKQRRQPVFTR